MAFVWFFYGFLMVSTDGEMAKMAFRWFLRIGKWPKWLNAMQTYGFYGLYGPECC